MIGDYDELIRANCESFFGYGPATAPVWFIGKQQGGGSNWDECQRRFDAWDKRGRRALEDIVGYHRAIGVDWWFADPPQRQPTWWELIRIRLAMADEPISDTSIGRYQVNRLAGWNGENCLFELLPLASPKPENTQIYAANSRLEWLKNGKTFMAEYGHKRAVHLKTMIDESHPKAVLFYSYSERADDYYQRHWRFISGNDFVQTQLRFTICAARDGVLYFIIPHPNRVSYLGLTAAIFFRDVGRLIATRLREEGPAPAGPTLRKRGS